MVGTSEVVTFMGLLLGLLLSGNIFFVKRLINKIDKTAVVQEGQAVSVTKISDGMNSLGIQLRDLKLEVKDFRRMEIDVAVIRSQCPNFNPVGGFCPATKNEKERKS